MKRSRWMWLKDKKKWTKKQIAQHHTLSRMQLKTGRAFRLKETLRKIFATASTKAVAKVQMQAWFRWARRSKLAFFKKLALTLKSHWDGILNGFDSALNNGSVEAINGLIQAAKARARGYRKPRNLMLMAYLIAAKLSHLPTSPYTTTYGDIIK
jgi:transposase